MADHDNPLERISKRVTRDTRAISNMERGGATVVRDFTNLSIQGMRAVGAVFGFGHGANAETNRYVNQDLASEATKARLHRQIEIESARAEAAHNARDYIRERDEHKYGAEKNAARAAENATSGAVYKTATYENRAREQYERETERQEEQRPPRSAAERFIRPIPDSDKYGPRSDASDTNVNNTKLATAPEVEVRAAPAPDKIIAVNDMPAGRAGGPAATLAYKKPETPVQVAQADTGTRTDVPAADTAIKDQSTTIQGTPMDDKKTIKIYSNGEKPDVVIRTIIKDIETGQMEGNREGWLNGLVDYVKTEKKLTEEKARQHIYDEANRNKISGKHAITAEEIGAKSVEQQAAEKQAAKEARDAAAAARREQAAEKNAERAAAAAERAAAAAERKAIADAAKAEAAQKQGVRQEHAGEIVEAVAAALRETDSAKRKAAVAGAVELVKSHTEDLALKNADGKEIYSLPGVTVPAKPGDITYENHQRNEKFKEYLDVKQINKMPTPEALVQAIANQLAGQTVGRDKANLFPPEEKSAPASERFLQPNPAGEEIKLNKPAPENKSQAPVIAPEAPSPVAEAVTQSPFGAVLKLANGDLSVNGAMLNAAAAAGTALAKAAVNEGPTAEAPKSIKDLVINTIVAQAQDVKERPEAAPSTPNNYAKLDLNKGSGLA